MSREIRIAFTVHLPDDVQTAATHTQATFTG